MALTYKIHKESHVFMKRHGRWETWIDFTDTDFRRPVLVQFGEVKPTDEEMEAKAEELKIKLEEQIANEPTEDEIFDEKVKTKFLELADLVWESPEKTARASKVIKKESKAEQFAAMLSADGKKVDVIPEREWL